MTFLQLFHSPTHGDLDFSLVVKHLVAFIDEKNGSSKYKIVIGTDSEMLVGNSADFVTAIVVHRIGSGGIYFWSRKTHQDMHTLRQRMWEEASYSLLMAQKLLDEFKRKNFSRFNLEIHVDIGANGDTREMINEIVGMIRGNGFEVKTKPEAFGASNVADRHTG